MGILGAGQFYFFIPVCSYSALFKKMLLMWSLYTFIDHPVILFKRGNWAINNEHKYINMSVDEVQILIHMIHMLFSVVLSDSFTVWTAKSRKQIIVTAQ